MTGSQLHEREQVLRAYSVLRKRYADYRFAGCLSATESKNKQGVQIATPLAQVAAAMITPAFTEFAEYQNMRNRLRTRKRSECGEQAARGMVVAVRGEAALRERVRPNVQKV
ncbi:hypothetical protein NFJ02_27g62120 [Pycnococcus provasolii]